MRHCYFEVNFLNAAKIIPKWIYYSTLFLKYAKALMTMFFNS